MSMLSVKTYRLLSLLVLLLPATVTAQPKMFQLERDSVPLFRGFTIMADLVGAAQMQLSDYGQLEGALRLNLHDQWFPVVELGYGRADHKNDEVTGISYKTQSPFFRVGCDFNLLKKKHSPYLLYIGLRYAFTSYKVTMERQNFVDPVWLWDTGYGVVDEPCSLHWAELTFGLDARVFGPVRLGWSARYRRRIYRNEGVMDNAWYVPGYGISGSSRLGAMFNIGIEL